MFVDKLYRRKKTHNAGHSPPPPPSTAITFAARLRQPLTPIGGSWAAACLQGILDFGGDLASSSKGCGLERCFPDNVGRSAKGMTHKSTTARTVLSRPVASHLMPHGEAIGWRPPSNPDQVC